MKCISIISLAFYAFGPARAGEFVSISQGVRYDENIPSLGKVVGHEFGLGITMHHEAMAYTQALAAASPKVTRLVRGKTWEGRDMVLLFVTSEANQKRLPEFQERYKAIADPRSATEEDFDRLTQDLPVLILLQESVHGNETSGTDSGLFLAWHLAAARNAPRVDHILDHAVVMIEVMQNPDGRDRFIQYNRQNRAPTGDADPQAAERDEPWAQGRFNHYLFDMNRDWFSLSQPETRAKVASFLDWFPQIVVDLHEMGSNSSFFAAAPSPPANPLLSKTMLDAYLDFGKAIGAALDQHQIDYFQGEIFDSFYPGYGEAWPSLHGAMGVLFEQASPRGLRVRQRNGRLLTYADAIQNQTLASLALIHHGSLNRTRMLRFFYDTRKSALEGLKEDRQVFLLPGRDLSRALSLGKLLQAQGIEVEQLGKAVRGINTRENSATSPKKTEIPKGALLVRFNQPAGRLARTLLLDHIDLDPDFLREQQRLRQKRQRTTIYDVTAWSLPMTFGVPTAYVSGGDWKEKGSPDLVLPSQTYNLTPSVGFLIRNTLNTGPVIAHLLNKKIKLSFTDKEIHHGGFEFPAGSLIVKNRDNPANLPEIIAETGNTFGLTVAGANSTWFKKGPGFGSDSVIPVKPPRVAMFWDAPTNPMSAGWMRYFMEQRLGYGVTALKTESISRFNLKNYDVMLMPGGSPSGWQHRLGESGIKALNHWVRSGGVLIAVGASSEWLTRDEPGFLSSHKEVRGGRIILDDEAEKPPKKPESDPLKMIEPLREDPENAYGTLMRVNFDPTHWLTFGMPESHAVMVNSNRIFRPLRLDQGANPGRFAEMADLLMSGYAEGSTLEQFANKPYLMVEHHGRGLVVAFTEDPNFRAFLIGLQPLLSNAIFFGPTQTNR